MLQEGEKVPNFSLNPKDDKPPYNAFIVKNIRDQDNYAFDPKIESSKSKIEVRDERAIEEVYGPNAQYDFFYYQEYIESEFEYKVYGIGEKLYFFKQIPVLQNPDKMKTRVAINPITEIGEITYKVMELFNLKITSLDFLRSKENRYYLTDVNSTPNFNYLKNGPEIVGNYLLSQAKK